MANRPQPRPCRWPGASARASQWLLLGLLLALLLSLPAAGQIVAGVSLGVPTPRPFAGPGTFAASGDLGIALPSAPHLLVFWDMARLGFDRLQGYNGASIATGFTAWISPAAHPAQSHAPLLLAEAGIGRRFGFGLHGFTTVGIGAGWSLGDWVPYVEYQRREGFHPGRQVQDRLVIGVRFIVFG